jgi:hypothetical protein
MPLHRRQFLQASASLALLSLLPLPAVAGSAARGGPDAAQQPLARARGSAWDNPLRRI